MNALERIIEDGNRRIDLITEIACLKLDAINKDYKAIEVVVEVEKQGPCVFCRMKTEAEYGLRQMAAAQSNQMDRYNMGGVGQPAFGGITGLIGASQGVWR